jgi:hypothetical protein
MSSDLWLPEGAHWDLNIEHAQLPDAGEFTGGGHKLVWHTTESERESVDAMWRVLRDKNAAPHVVIGWRDGFKYPVAIQCIPFNRAGRALAAPVRAGDEPRERSRSRSAAGQRSPIRGMRTGTRRSRTSRC